MMPGSEEVWRDRPGTTPGALGHLIERMANDFAPQHDSRHYQAGFVPSSAPPWTTPGQAPLAGLGPPMAPLQAPHGSIGAGPQGGPGPASRSYSVSQDLFSEPDGGRSPLLRSSSDLGLRLNHYQGQGGPFGDGRLDGLMDASVDSLDGGARGGHEAAFLPEVRGGGPAPPSGGTPPPLRGASPAPRPEFSFYSRESEGEAVSNISAKFSNFPASLGSWFGPSDPFRTNLSAAQAGAPCASRPAPPPPAQPQAGAALEAVQPRAEEAAPAPRPAKASRPSYSDVLSKSPAPAQEGRLGLGGPAANSRSSSSNSNSSGGGGGGNLAGHPPQSSSPQSSRPEQKARPQGCGKAKARGQNGRPPPSRVAPDGFDPDVGGGGGLGNGCISAYEHYDWGECLGPSSAFRATASGPVGRAKRNVPERAGEGHPAEGEARGNDQLNNRVTSGQKQPPKKTSYINNILNATTSPSISTTSVTTTTWSSSQATANHTATIPSASNTAASSPANHTINNNDCERSDGIKIKNMQMSKEDKKNQDNAGSLSSGGRGGRNKGTPIGRSRDSLPKRVTTKRRKDTAYTHSELIVQGWAVAVQWVGLVMQAAVWLGTLAADVVVMSSRLFLHLMTLMWAKILDYWITMKINARHYWTRLTTAFSKKDKEEKKIPGREKKVPRGLECNISLPITGDEAMKRLLACKGKDPYSILGVTQECTDEDIKKYYKRQAILVHPDKNKQPGAEEAFKILAHAFEIIGEPERRREYDARLAEEVQLEGAWGELASLLTRLQEKLDEAANTIRCTNCNKRHRRVKLPRPIYAARHCTECQIHHAAREGDIWAESTLLGLRWRYYACMEGAVYDISDWAACQSENLKHLQANTHSVQYRIVSGKKNPPSKNNSPEFPSDPDLEEFFNNLCKEKFGKIYTSGNSQAGGQQMPDTRKRKGKKKK